MDDYRAIDYSARGQIDQPTTVIGGRQFTGYLFTATPGPEGEPLSPAATMADILATVQQHHSSDFTCNRHVTKILLSHHDAPHISFLSRIKSSL